MIEIRQNPMSKEHPQPQPEQGFPFNERERLFERIHHQRFLAFLGNEKTTVHSVELSTNTYGEFLFVTASHPAGEKQDTITFWGLGLHEYRERYYLDEWCFYEATQTTERMASQIEKGEAFTKIEERRREIEPLAINQHQSQRGKLFEMIADLTDDDGAYAELQDMDMDDVED